MDLFTWYKQRKSVLDQDQISYKSKSRLFQQKNVDELCAYLSDFIQHQNELKHDVVVFCDYDTDGVCSGKVAYESLILAGMNPDKLHVMPDNRIEGFGFDDDYANQILQNYPQTGLIITSDNGTSSFPTAVGLKDLGVKLIVTDHHPQSENLHFAMEHRTAYDYNQDLVNPVQYNSTYAFRGLSGTGVVWKFFQRYFYLKLQSQKLTLNNQVLLKKFNQLIAYVALTVVSDSMQMIDENRSFVIAGLNMINQDKADKIWSLLKSRLGQVKLNTKQTYFTEKDFGWILAPIFNADSRIHLVPRIVLFFLLPQKRAELLSHDKTLQQVVNHNLNLFADLSSMQNTDDILSLMIKTNQLRKNIVNQVLIYLNQSQQADLYVVKLDENILSNDLIKAYQKITNRSQVELSPIAGIIAGRLSTKFHQPSLVIAKETELKKTTHTKNEKIGYNGSSRSENFNLLLIDRSNSGIPEVEIAGHQHAAGVSIITNDLKSVVERINQVINDNLIRKTVKNNYLSPNNVTVEDLKAIDQLRPFGMDFPEPQFKFKIDFGAIPPQFKVQKIDTRKGKHHLKLVNLKNGYQLMIWNIDQNKLLMEKLQDYFNLGKGFKINFVTSMEVGEFNWQEFCQATINSSAINIE